MRKSRAAGSSTLETLLRRTSHRQQPERHRWEREYSRHGQERHHQGLDIPHRASAHHHYKLEHYYGKRLKSDHHQEQHLFFFPGSHLILWLESNWMHRITRPFIMTVTPNNLKTPHKTFRKRVLCHN